MSGRRASWFAAGRDERGSILPMTALMVTVVLGFTAFAVDLGLNRVAVRDMQSVADAVALDTARSDALSTCSVSALEAKADESLARQSRRMGRTAPLVVTPGQVDATGAFRPASSDCNAVRITSSTEIDYAFAPVIGTDSGTARRSAVARRNEAAICWSVGTGLLTLDTSTGTLAPLLDRILSVNLRAVNHTGLVDVQRAELPLLRLQTALGVGTITELLETEMSLSELVRASAAALEANGQTVEASVLRGVAFGVPGASFSMADILTLGTATTGAGLDASVNVLDLIGAAAVAANGENAVSVDVPNVASVRVIEPPKIACGRRGSDARATSAQIQVVVASGLSAANLTGGEVNLSVQAARGSASLESLTCSPDQATLEVSTAGAVISPANPTKPPIRLDVTRAKFLELLAPLDPVGLLRTALRALGIDRISLDVDVAARAFSSTDRKTFDYPASGLPESQKAAGQPAVTLDALGVKLSANQGSVVGVLGGVLSSVLNSVLSGVVVPTVSGVVNPLLNIAIDRALNDVLGLETAVTEVSVLGRPDCRGTRLVG